MEDVIIGLCSGVGGLFVGLLITRLHLFHRVKRVEGNPGSDAYQSWKDSH